MSKRSPAERLCTFAAEAGVQVTEKSFAKFMDEKDELKAFRKEFHYPKMKEIMFADQTLVDPEEDSVYFVGNSLGLCPKKTEEYIKIQLEKWSKIAIHGHRHGELPWATCDECVDGDMAKIVGGQHGEVALMNGLTVNLHLLLVSFYRPTATRHKIMCESKSFPSDHYAFESQIRLHGYNPAESLVLLEPRQGETTLRTEDIVSRIQEEGDSIAVVCLPGVQYYTGQLFDIPTITKAGQAKGCYVGWDLAHAVGNVELHLHDWGVDFATWCTYKYLCSGAGGIGGAFLHKKHEKNDFPKLLGWWGHKLETRFVMDNDMDLSPGIYGYRISNPAGMLIPSLKASLELYNKATLPALRQKSLLLTGYLELLIRKRYGRPDKKSEDPDAIYIDILTPSDPEQRGAQLSLSFNVNIHHVLQELYKRGVSCDKRLPRVIRIAPVPIFCSFEDVHRFMKYLEQSLTAAKAQGHVDHIPDSNNV
ncbi:kynureninase-like [Haliotis asinina]|uniref:kynureninase-like n=1 Tax=Haliotis asinina TaxID=109174 RepID=UPI003532225C